MDVCYFGFYFSICQMLTLFFSWKTYSTVNRLDICLILLPTVTQHQIDLLHHLRTSCQFFSESTNFLFRASISALNLLIVSLAVDPEEEPEVFKPAELPGLWVVDWEGDFLEDDEPAL